MNNTNPYFNYDCPIECENANQCEYYNFNDNVNYNLQYPQQQPIQNNENFQFNYNNGNNFSAYDDSVVPTNFYENSNNDNVSSYQPYQTQQQQTFNQIPSSSNAVESYSHNNNNSDNTHTGVYPTNFNYAYADSLQTHPPCVGPQPWNFAQCYGYYGDAPCQFANVIDMEDFM